METFSEYTPVCISDLEFVESQIGKLQLAIHKPSQVNIYRFVSCRRKSDNNGALFMLRQWSHNWIKLILIWETKPN